SLVFLLTATATTRTYTLSLHDALPIFAEDKFNLEQRLKRDPSQAIPAGKASADSLLSSEASPLLLLPVVTIMAAAFAVIVPFFLDRKSTRLNSSHLVISYAVFCLKKKI